MASKYLCRCGEMVRTNLYEGHGLHLLVSETLTDLPPNELEKSCEQLVDVLVSKSSVVATCKNCGTIAIINHSYDIKLYTPFND